MTTNSDTDPSELFSVALYVTCVILLVVFFLAAYHKISGMAERQDLDSRRRATYLCRNHGGVDSWGSIRALCNNGKVIQDIQTYNIPEDYQL